MMSLICGILNDTNELVYETEIDLQKKTLWLPKGEAVGRDKWVVWDEQTQTTIYKIGSQQEPSIWYRELYSVL